MKHPITSCLLGALLGLSTAAQAQDLGLALQADLGLAKGGDLKVTASGLPVALGAQANFVVRKDILIKPRLEAWFFGQGRQDLAGAPLAQTIHTKVQAQMAGADVLYRFSGKFAPLALGAGAYLVRWRIASSDTLSDAGGDSFAQSSSSTWTRPGLALAGAWRLSSHLELEARWISSSEGYQKLSNNLLLGGAAWRF